MQIVEPEDWTSSLWTNTLELHQQDFIATNVIDWEESFANKTVETYIFWSLMSYSLNIYFNYINKTVDDKDPPRMSGWNRNCVLKWKKQCLNALGQSGDFLFDSTTYLKMDVVADLLFFIHMCIVVILVIAISLSDHNS